MFETKLIIDFIGDDKEDDDLLKEMADDAKNYFSNLESSNKILEIRFGDGIGGIVASFLIKYLENNADIEKYIWVVVGDIPSYSFDTNDTISNGEDAIYQYCSLMMEWVDAIFEKKPIEYLIKLNVPPTIEWAENLSQRINTITKFFLR